MNVNQIINEEITKILNENFNSIYNFFDNINPKKGTFGNVYVIYKPQLPKFLDKKHKIKNPYYYEDVKVHQRFLFHYKDTYERALKRKKEQISISEKYPSTIKLSGYDILEKDSKGVVYLPIIPTNLKDKNAFVFTVNGNVEGYSKVMRFIPKYAIEPVHAKDDVDFVLININDIFQLNIGGKKWVNSYLKNQNSFIKKKDAPPEQYHYKQYMSGDKDTSHQYKNKFDKFLNKIFNR